MRSSTRYSPTACDEHQRWTRTATMSFSTVNWSGTFPCQNNRCRGKSHQRRFIDDDRASQIAAQLRFDKASGKRRRGGVSEHLEIVLIPKEPHGLYTLYPSLFLFSTPARLIRPVMNLLTQTTEYVGTFEQVYLGICITHDEFVAGVSTPFPLQSGCAKRHAHSLVAHHSPRVNPVQLLIDHRQLNTVQ